MISNRILRLMLVLLCAAGLFVSVLALRVHNQDPSAAPPCAVTEHFDCGAVNHSRFAVFPPRIFGEDEHAKGHLPVAVVGICGYLLLALLAGFGRLWVVLHLAEFAFMCACFLTYLEAYVLEKWCIYCLWSQGIITTILLATIVALLLRRWEGGRRVRSSEPLMQVSQHVG